MIDQCPRGKARPASPRPAHASPDLGHRSERWRPRSRLTPGDRSLVPDVRPIDRSMLATVQGSLQGSRPCATADQVPPPPTSVIDRCCRGKAGPASPRLAHATPDLGHRSERRRPLNRLAPADCSRVPDVRPVDRCLHACSPPCKGRGRRADPAPPPTRSRRPGLGDRSLLAGALCCCCRLA